MSELKQALQYIKETVQPALDAKDIDLIIEYDQNHVMAGGTPCSGYFCDVDKVLAVAVGNKKIKDWFGTLLHEFCHFEQWSENAKAWTDSQEDGHDLLDRYLDGEEIEGIDDYIRRLAYLEYDCEVRTVEKIKGFPNIFDVSEYIQKSNAYIAFYKQCLEFRQWYCPNNAPYLNYVIWCDMPRTFYPFASYWENYGFGYINWNSTFLQDAKSVQARIDVACRSDDGFLNIHALTDFIEKNKLGLEHYGQLVYDPRKDKRNCPAKPLGEGIIGDCDKL